MIYPDSKKKAAGGPGPDHARIYIPPPLIFLFVFWIGRMLNSLLPFWTVERPVRALGWAIAFVGAMLALWSIQFLRQARTAILPHRSTTAIVSTGPYRLSRNPIYLSLLLIYTGAALGADTFWAVLLIPAVLLLVNGLVIRREERYLEQKFGPEYLDYKKQVRRWI